MQQLSTSIHARAMIWLIALAAAVVCDFGNQETARTSAAVFTVSAVLFGFMFLTERRRRFVEDPGTMWRLGECGMSCVSGIACFIASNGVWFK